MPPSDPPAPPATPAPRDRLHRIPPRPPPRRHPGRHQPIYDTSPHHRNSDALAELQLPPRVTQPMERVHRAPSTLFLVFSRKPRPLRTEGPHPPLSPRSSSLLTSPLLRADLRFSAPPRQDHTLAISHSLPPRVRPWH